MFGIRKVIRDPDRNSEWWAQVPKSLIRVLVIESAKGADLLNRAGYRRGVGRVIRAWEKFRCQSCEDEGGWSSGGGAHGRLVSNGMSFISFMQGGNRAPRLMRALDEGPNIGFTTGYVARTIRNRPEPNKPTLKTRTLNENGLPCSFPLYASS